MTAQHTSYPANHQLINQDSGKVEWYTPSVIVEAARSVMGAIDLDPASSAKANEIVKAETYFDSYIDGLDHAWFGRVWMNHPFGRKENKLWIDRLVYHYVNEDIEQACCITFASMSAQWMRPLLDYPMCFPHKRINYLLPNGKVQKGVTKGSVITYLGKNTDLFMTIFEGRGIGTVKL